MGIYGFLNWYEVILISYMQVLSFMGNDVNLIWKIAV